MARSGTIQGHVRDVLARAAGVDLAALRLLHRPVPIGYLGEWCHEHHVSHLPFEVARAIRGALPAHAESPAFPGHCALSCHVEIDGTGDWPGCVTVDVQVCRTCGGGIDEDGEWHGHVWPCPTARAAGIGDR